MGCLCKQAWVCVWERGHFNRVRSRAGGGEEVESAIWMRERERERERERQREKWKGGEEEGEEGETQQPTSSHLMLPAGPGDADSTVLLNHSPSPTSSPVFCSQSLFLLPLCCSVCDAPRSVSSSSRMTLQIWSLLCHIVRSADAYA